MYPCYFFDSGLTIDLPRELYIWWKTYYAFHGSPIENVKVRIVAKTKNTLENYFIRKKPPRQVLTNMEPI